ncbi:hypothetical protein H072_2879 [Dactylellina haptotyla CBS 200.50]|uniref:Uncharacterized protein n=1 Tax=Dactylellina haptotyla (strain CBS 200.50) TaxID=1284197 RepID=S8C622_DACHA|nr:hypothetical protein H072_2879 [Dactylellina haptotyla CBS 200.50]
MSGKPHNLVLTAKQQYILCLGTCTIVLSDTVRVPRVYIDDFLTQNVLIISYISGNLTQFASYVTTAHPISDTSDSPDDAVLTPTLVQLVKTIKRSLETLNKDIQDPNIWENTAKLQKYGLDITSKSFRSDWYFHRSNLIDAIEEYQSDVDDVPVWYIYNLSAEFYSTRAAEPQGVLIWMTIEDVVGYLQNGYGTDTIAIDIDLTDPFAVLLYILNGYVIHSSGAVIFQLEDSETLMTGFKKLGTDMDNYLNHPDWDTLDILFGSIRKEFESYITTDTPFFQELEGSHVKLTALIRDYVNTILDIATSVRLLRNVIFLWMEQYDIVTIPDLED